MNKELVVAVVALVIAIGSVLFPNTTTTIVEKLGSSAGTDHSFFEIFGAGMANGGELVSTSTVTSSTLKAADLMRASCIEMTLTQDDGTLTLPATSTLAGWLPPGGHRDICFRNATGTAAVDLTIAVGAGMTFKNSASSTAAVIGDTDGDNTIWARFLRKSDRDYNVYLTRFHD